MADTPAIPTAFKRFSRATSPVDTSVTFFEQGAGTFPGPAADTQIARAAGGNFSDDTFYNDSDTD